MVEITVFVHRRSSKYGLTIIKMNALQLDGHRCRSKPVRIKVFARRPSTAVAKQHATNTSCKIWRAKSRNICITPSVQKVGVCVRVDVCWIEERVSHRVHIVRPQAEVVGGQQRESTVCKCPRRPPLTTPQITRTTRTTRPITTRRHSRTSTGTRTRRTSSTHTRRTGRAIEHSEAEDFHSGLHAGPFGEAHAGELRPQRVRGGAVCA